MTVKARARNCGKRIGVNNAYMSTRLRRGLIGILQMQEVQRREDSEDENTARDFRWERHGRSATDCFDRSWRSRGRLFLVFVFRVKPLILCLPFSKPDLPAGDVIFVLHLKKHPTFERSGNDLLTRVKITLSEALLGFSRILLTHLDGRGIKVRSPPGKIIKPGDSIVLRNEGMPVHKDPGQKGDLYVILDIEMPDERWFKSVDRTVGSAISGLCTLFWRLSSDRQTLAKLIPPKKSDVDPLPAIVDDANFEESDIVDVRQRSFPASSDFFDQGFASQFGDGDEDDWEDDDDDDERDYDDGGPDPECRPQWSRPRPASCPPFCTQIMHIP
jgi:curved DNA-binding protein CbpA